MVGLFPLNLGTLPSDIEAVASKSEVTGPVWYPVSMADWSSVVGLIVGVIGFWITIWQLLRTRKAADAAKRSADEVRTQVSMFGAVRDLNASLTLLSQIKAATVDPDLYHTLPDRCDRLRVTLIQLRSLCKTLSKDESSTIQSLIVTARELETKINTNRGNTLDLSNYFPVFNEPIDLVNDLIAKLTIREEPL